MKTQKVALSSVAKIIMGTSPKGDTYNNTGNGLPLINGPTEFGDDHPDCTLFTTKSSKECNAGDLIFCVRGSTTGRMNWADKKYSLGRGVCSIRGNTQADTIYIRYCIEQSLHKLLQFASGATFPNLTKDTIVSFKIPYPNDRERIVDIVQKYDTLANTNRRRIQLLEEAARLLFREWFVYFRFPLLRQGFGGQAGHEKVRMADGVPEGWKSEKLNKLVSFLGGHAFKSTSYKQEGKYGIVTIKNVQQGSFIPECTDYLDETPNAMKKHCFLSNGDILISLTGNVGRVCLVYGENYLLNQRVAKIESKNKIPKCFIYWMFDNPIMQKRIENLSYGSAQQNLSPIKLGEQTVILPPDPLLESFDEIVSLINIEIIQLLIQNQKLAQARDLLLPRLMSGAIDPVRYDKLSNGVEA
jgi:type I restriction enzyme S subunit